MAKKEKIIEKAQKFLSKGNIDKALVEYKKAFEMDKSDLSLQLKLGDLYVKTGDKEAAINEYTEIAKIHTNKGFYLKGIAVYKQILKLDETTLEVHNKLADLYTKQRLMADAISEYSYILNNYEKKGRTSESLELLKKMVDLDPDNVGTKLKLADMHQKLGFDKDAISEFRWVCDRLVSQGKLDKAEKIYLGVQKNYPSELEILEGLAELYKKKGENHKFLKVANLVVASLKDSGDTEKASAFCKSILEIDPGNKIARMLMNELGGEVPEADGSEESDDEDLSAEGEDGGEPLISWPEASAEVTPEEAAELAEAEAADREAELAEEAAREAKEAEKEAVKEAAKEADEGEEEEELVEVDIPDDEPMVEVETGEDETEVEVEEPLVEVEVGEVEAGEVEAGEVEAGEVEAGEVEAGEVETAEEELVEVDIPDEPMVEVEADEPVVEVETGEVETGEVETAEAELDEPLVEVEAGEVEAGEVETEDVETGEVETGEVETVEVEAGEVETGEEETEADADEPIVEMETGEMETGEEEIEPFEVEPDEGEEIAEFEAPEVDSIEVAEVDESIVEDEIDELNGEDSEELITPLEELEEVVEVSPEELSSGFDDEEDEGVSLENEFVDLSKELGLEEALDDLVSGWTDDESGEAAEEFKDSIGKQLSKEDSETHFNLGIAYMEMELYDDAIKEFKIALKDPGLEIDSYNRLGLCSMAKGNVDDTVEFYLKALKVKGSSDDERMGIMYELALAYEAGDKTAEAGEMFGAVAEMDPDYREVAEKMADYADMAAAAPAASAIPSNDSVIEVELL